MNKRYSYLSFDNMETISSKKDIKDFLGGFFSKNKKYNYNFEKVICLFYGYQTELFFQYSNEPSDRKIAIRFPMVWDGIKTNYTKVISEKTYMYYPMIEKYPFSKKDSPKKISEAIKLHLNIKFMGNFEKQLPKRVVEALKYFVAIKEFYKYI